MKLVTNLVEWMETELLSLQVPIATAEAVSNLRVRFCLEANDVLCGSYAEAKLVEVSPAVGGGGLAEQPWLIAVVIFIVVAAIMAIILVVKCCCCTR